MDDDSEEIYTTGLVDRYTKRPHSLEHVSLADWVAWYDLQYKPYTKKSDELDLDNLPLETNIDANNDDDDDDEEDVFEKKKK